MDREHIDQQNLERFYHNGFSGPDCTVAELIIEIHLECCKHCRARFNEIKLSEESAAAE